MLRGRARRATPNTARSVPSWRDSNARSAPRNPRRNVIEAPVRGFVVETRSENCTENWVICDGLSVAQQPMSILASLHHVTRYRYDRLVALAPQVIRLRPAPHCRTRIESYSLKVTPAQHFVNWQQDPNETCSALSLFPKKTPKFPIPFDPLSTMPLITPFFFFAEPFAKTFPSPYPAEFAEELAPYLDAEPAGARLSAFLA